MPNDSMIVWCSVPRRVESDNSFKWSPWYIYDRYRKQWYRLLEMLLGPCPEIKKPAQKRFVMIASLRRRLLDYGNLVGGAKPIPDYLVRAGWLIDDDVENVEVLYLQMKVKAGEERTIVAVTSRQWLESSWKTWLELLPPDDVAGSRVSQTRKRSASAR